MEATRKRGQARDTYKFEPVSSVLRLGRTLSQKLSQSGHARACEDGGRWGLTLPGIERAREEG